MAPGKPVGKFFYWLEIFILLLGKEVFIMPYSELFLNGLNN